MKGRYWEFVINIDFTLNNSLESGCLGFPRVNPWMQYFTNMFHYGRPLRHKPMHSSYIRCIVVHANLASTLWLIGDNQAIHDIATVSFK